MIKFWYDIQSLSHRYIEFVNSHHGGTIHVRLPNGTVKEYPRQSAIPINEASHEVQEPEELMEAMIQAGIKPNKLEGTTGHVEALKQHIAFAQSVVDRVLKK